MSSDVEGASTEQGVDDAASIRLRQLRTFFLAASSGDLEVLKYCIQHGVDVNWAADTDDDTFSDTPQGPALAIAAEENQVEAARFLLENGADVDHYGKDLYADGPALVRACQNGNPRIVQLLTAHGAKSYNFVYLGESAHAVPLCAMSLRKPSRTSDHLACVDALLQAGYDVNSADGNGDTALSHAIQQGHMGLFELVMTYAPDLTVASLRGTPLAEAARYGRLAMAQALLTRVQLDHGKAGLVTQAREALLQSPRNEELFYMLWDVCEPAMFTRPEESALLHAAAAAGAMNLVQHYLSCGFDPNARSASGRTPLHVFARNHTSESELDLVDILCKAGADLEAQDEDGNTPLHMAQFRLNERSGYQPGKRYPKVMISQRLLLHGADPNTVNHKGRSALHTCIERPVPRPDHPGDRRAPTTLNSAKSLCPIAESEALAHLLSHDADVNARDVDGVTALHLACSKRNVDIIAILLASGADVNCQDNRGRTPLFHCLRLRFLMSEFSPHFVDRDQLYYYVWPWTVELAIDMLLDAGADINVRSYNGDNLLHVAVEEMNDTRLAGMIRQTSTTSLIKHLVDAGLDLMATNSRGKTATDMCADLGKPNLLAILEQCV